MTRTSDTVAPPNAIQGVLRPTGYRILVCIPRLEAQMKRNQLFMPDNTRELLEAASLIAVVVELGPDAYKDAVKFPNGPWCKPGDMIMMRAYSGTRFKVQVDGNEYRLINDDTVQAVVTDADQIERV